MRLPKDILTKTAVKPNVYLCEVDKSKICKLEVSDLQGNFKFNGLSELSFEVGRTYNDTLTGAVKVNPYYDKIESLRLVYLEGFGYFELQGPELISDGIKEAKSCKTYSFEYTLTQKYLTDFYINKGTTDSLEVLNAPSDKEITPISLYNQAKPQLSLLHLILSEGGIYGWKIGHVDKQLQTLSRQFEVDRESVYDFIINEICEKFNCYVVFDTINNTINFYAESPTAKFIADGKTNTFEIKDDSNAHPFSTIETVSIDGYKTTRYTYTYSNERGILVLEDTPESGVMIEVIGIDSTWETDVFVTFDNLSQEITVSYDADSIKTKLDVTYGDDENIREVNLGLPYLVDLSYYYTVDWMGQDLYDAYTAYLEKSNNSQSEYANNSKEILKLNDYISYEENRLSLEYSSASVSATTVGTYYTRQQNADGSYYYTEVSLPSEYIAGTKYYSNATTNLTEKKVSDLHSALKNYFYACFKNLSDELKAAIAGLNALSDAFSFMKTYTLSYLVDGLQKATSDNDRDTIIYNFLGEMWHEVGRTPLKTLYLPTYETIQKTDTEAGWSTKDNDNYGYYYPTVLFINSLKSTISQRDKIIADYKSKQEPFQQANTNISDGLLLDNNFTEGQLIRLSAFLREDELHIDDIVETSIDDLASSMKLKQDAKETGTIELKKISQPQLQFSMDMANIYALPEFEPIINQFQLGKIIKVALRPDYIKQSRLLAVNINFDDLSDFSCEFGELTSLRSQSDIHADLLANAISAGKSVAANRSSWTRGSDLATATDLRIQQGLLDATTVIKSVDGTQGVVIDKNGILLQKYNQDGSVDLKQARIVNNMILMTDDGWQTSRTGLGEFEIDNQTFYGLIAEAVLSGYIESSTIVGGTIQIGLQEDGSYAFAVNADGSVTMGGGSSIKGYATTQDVENSIKNTNPTIVSDTRPENVTKGQLWVDTSITPNTLKVWDGSDWVNSNYQTSGAVYTSQPSEYKVGDLWILAEKESVIQYIQNQEITQDTSGVYWIFSENQYIEVTLPDGYVDNTTYYERKEYGHSSMLKATQDSKNFDQSHWIDVTNGTTATIITNIKESFTWDDTGIQIAKKVMDDDGNVTNPFYVHIDSTRMGFHSVEYDKNNQPIQDTEVVHIGNNSATIQNATFKGDKGTMFANNATFQESTTFKQNNSSTGFVWQIEADGSLSLAISN